MIHHAIPPRPVVLVVEDEPIVRMAAADALEESGFEVIEAVNSQAALNILGQRQDIQVLFTDVQMPGSMNGLELAALVHGRWPHIRIVITSGHFQPGSGEVPEKAVFLPKPYRECAPAEVIRELL